MRSLGHPDYVYQPHSEARRQAQSDAARARFGLKPGERMLYGTVVPDAVAARISPVIRRIASKHDAAMAARAMRAFKTDGVWALRTFMRDVPSQARARLRLARKLKAKAKVWEQAQRCITRARIREQERRKLEQQFQREIDKLLRRVEMLEKG